MFEIVTDSSANLPNELIEKYRINILSLKFYIAGQEYESYVKGEDNDLKKFYTMMRQKEMITTSCMSPTTCLEMFEPYLNEGKDIIYIGFSSNLSGTFQTASGVINELRAKYPQRKIYAVDTLAASLGEGLLVTYAARMKEEGKSIDEILEWLLDNRLKLCHWFTVDDLFFLKRGGRISASTALVGSILGIKPVLHMDNDGRLTPFSKVRYRTKALDALVEQMERLAVNPKDQLVYISHGDCYDDAKYVAESICKKFGVFEDNIVIHYVDPVIGAHSGPGTVALFFIGKER